MTEQPYVDPGHRLPDEEWGAVAGRAAQVRAEHEAEHGTPEPPADLDGVS